MLRLLRMLRSSADAGSSVSSAFSVDAFFCGWLHMVHRLASLAVLVAVTASLSAQGGGLPQEPIALVNANVVSVSDGAVQRGVTVVLRGGRIESIGASPAPAGV